MKARYPALMELLITSKEDTIKIMNSDFVCNKTAYSAINI